VANIHANAALGVKTVKRMRMDIVSANGILDRALVSRALLLLRNTPDRDSKLSPAKPLYGRELRYCLPRPGSALMWDMWMNLVDAKDTVMDRDRKLSPTKALLGRELRDFLPRPGAALMGDMWMNLVDAGETAQVHMAKH
jgi:hypothetical protein